MSQDYIEGIKEAVRVIENCYKGDYSDLPVNPVYLNELALKVHERGKRERQQIIEAVARGWCHVETEDRIMDAALVDAIVDEIMRL